MSHALDYIEGLRRRRECSLRVEPLFCGCRDPLPHRCEPSPIRGYVEAAEHLLSHGLPPAPNIAALRAMWREGGRNQRLALRVVELWTVAA
jgi:hypothetical protein